MNVATRLLGSQKFWTTIVALIATSSASILAKWGLELSDATVQQVGATVAILFGILLHAQGRTDQGKEAAKVAATMPAVPQQVQINDATIEAPSGPMLPIVVKPDPAAAPKPGGNMIDKVGLLLLALILLGACPSHKPYLPPVTHPIVDCVAEASADQLVVSWLSRRPGWDVVKDEAITAGITIGGCAFAAYLQKYLAPASGTAVPPPEDALDAKSAFEGYRNVYANNSTFRFKSGDL